MTYVDSKSIFGTRIHRYRSITFNVQIIELITVNPSHVTSTAVENFALDHVILEEHMVGHIAHIERKEE